MCLTPEQVESFDRDGFVIVRQAISPETLKVLRSTSDALVEQSRDVTASDDFFKLAPGHSRATPRLHRLAQPVVLSEHFWRAATSERVLNCVEKLIGPNIKFHHSKLNMKSGDGGVSIGWHQDFAFFPHTNFDVIGCGIALDDCSTENGCLMVVPGSHKGELLNHRKDDGAFVGEIRGDDRSRFDAKDAVAIELKAGDMSIHHARAIHGSSANTSQRQRRLFIVEYVATDAIQLDHKPPANKYSERIVRGAPATYARLQGAIRIRLRGDSSSGGSIFDRQATKSMR